MSDDYETIEAKLYHAEAELQALKDAIRWADEEMSQHDFASLTCSMLSVRESGSNRYSDEEKAHAQTLLRVLEEE